MINEIDIEKNNFEKKNDDKNDSGKDNENEGLGEINTNKNQFDENQILNMH